MIAASITMIVKIQLALGSSEHDPPALVYNEGHTFEMMIPVSMLGQETVDILNSSPVKKGYFAADVTEGVVIIYEELPIQSW